MDQPKKYLKIIGGFVEYFLKGSGILFWILLIWAKLNL